MKRKMIWCCAIAVIILVAGFGGYKMGLFEKILAPRQEVEQDESRAVADVVEGRELMAVVSTEEEAKEIASLYDIELVMYADGVAEYTTKEPLHEAILKGKEAGYPEVFVNLERNLY